MTIDISPRHRLLPFGGCRRCALLKHCGGLDSQQALWGCFGDCTTPGLCEDRDWTCLCRQSTFVRRWRQVGGLPPPLPRTLQPLVNAALPLYVPIIQHGSSRDCDFAADLVALPTARVARRRRRGAFGPRSTTAAELRKEFRLAPSTRVLLVSAGFDEGLELLWEHRTTHNLPAALARLGILGITIPNYSYFLDAPRTHTLWNRYRMVRLAEQLSQAGLPVVLHLNGTTTADWDFWHDLLRRHPGMAYVVKEFQTGNKNPIAGAEVVVELRRLQHRLKRALHPIAVGGAKFVTDFAREFSRFTIIDSEPFMKTVFRRRLAVMGDGRFDWRPAQTAPGQRLDDLLALNVRRYGDALATQAEHAALTNRDQLSLPQVL